MFGKNTHTYIYIRTVLFLVVLATQCCVASATVSTKQLLLQDEHDKMKALRHEQDSTYKVLRHEQDSIYKDYMRKMGDSIPLPIYKMFSFHTNVVDWVLATPNVTVELDLSPRRHTSYSLLLTGKGNPKGKSTNFNPRWVYNVSSIKGEIRKYWRTSNRDIAADQEDAKIPFDRKKAEERIAALKNKDEAITLVPERDTTIWGPFSKLSYLRRRYVSARYVKRPRFWRAYYVGLWAAYTKFSICLDGDGKQGNAYAGGVSAGMSVPLYKHLDGSGWDLDLGASVGLMLPAYQTYKYYRESGCYAFQEWHLRHFRDQHQLNFEPVLQDLRVSLVYRFRSIDKKVLYGSKRFELREERRSRREADRVAREALKVEGKEIKSRYTAINRKLEQSKEQLALYTDTAAYYYEVLKTAIDYVEKDDNYANLLFDSQWEFHTEVWQRYLDYYMGITNEMVPEELRTDRSEREARRIKAEKQQQKEADKAAKEAEKQAKEAEKQAKEAEKQAAKDAKAAEKEAAKETEAAQETPESKESAATPDNPETPETPATPQQEGGAE